MQNRDSNDDSAERPANLEFAARQLAAPTMSPLLSPERWRTVEPILDAALALHGDARVAFLEDIRQKDNALHAELAGMLFECESLIGNEHAINRPATLSFRALADDTESYATLRAALEGRYNIERVAGRGSMGTVYVAHDCRHDRTVAVKVLASAFASGRIAERFTREIQITARLRHPRLLPLYDSGEAAGQFFFVTPYVGGGTLRDRLAHGAKYGIDEARLLLRDIAEALAYAHEQGVTHRDVKPENVLLDATGAVLADFGIASAIARAAIGHAKGEDAALRTLAPRGTPAYMPPEQAAGDAAIDHRADLYALGVIGYELLTGAHPFATRSPSEMLAAHLTVTPTPLHVRRPDIPAPLCALVMQLLEKRAADRPSSAANVVNAIDVIGAHAAVSERNRVAVAPTGRKPLSGRWLVGGGIAALVLVAAWNTQHQNANVGLTRSTPPLTTSEPSTQASAGVLARDSIQLSSPSAGAQLPVTTAHAPIASTQIGMTALRQPVSRVTRVLVVPMESEQADSALTLLGRVAANYIEEGLVPLDIVEVLSSITPPATKGESALLDVAAAAGANVVVSGQCYTDGDSIRIQARVIDVAQRRVIGVMPLVSAPRADPRAMLEPLRQRVLGALAVNYDARTEVVRSGASPPTYDAYALQVVALEYFERADWHEAIRYYARAAALDSTYTDPLGAMAAAHLNAGEPALADSVARRLEKRRATLSPVDRAKLDQLRGWIDGNHMAALVGARAIASATPGSQLSHYLHANDALHAGFPREALVAAARIENTFGRAASGWPAIALWTNVATANHLLGEYKQELKAARTALALYPESARLRATELRALTALGQIDSVTAGVAALAVMAAASGVQSDAELLVQIALELDARGHHTEARETLLHALDANAALPDNKRRAFSARYQRARTLYALGEYDAAEPLLMRLVADSANHLGANLTLGLVAARRGDHAEARRLMIRLRAIQRPYDNGATSYSLARMSAALGDFPDAMKLFKQSFLEGVKRNGDFHAEQEFAPLRNDPEFRQLIKPQG
ncbi:MAG: serine/threonine-protein kinase [bacterium]